MSTLAPITLPPMPRSRGGGLSHCGQVRPHNEDAILTAEDGLLWAVADGMGGYGNGELAAHMVIDALSNLTEIGKPTEALRAALSTANAEIFNRSLDNDIGQMGSTVVAAMVLDRTAHIAWVGDSRAYLLRGNHLSRLTRDHSLVQEMVDGGIVRPEDADSHPQSHVITRAVGVEPMVLSDVVACALEVGDRILLCSDGLTCCVAEDLIRMHLSAGLDPDPTCNALVGEALVQGAPDNVSVVLIDILGE